MILKKIFIIYKHPTDTRLRRKSEKVEFCFFNLNQLEGYSEMMVLQNRFVIVDESKFCLSVNKELVGDARVVNVVDAAGEYSREDLKGCEDLLQGSAAKEDVGRLGDVRGMEMIVIWNLLNIGKIIK